MEIETECRAIRAELAAHAHDDEVRHKDLVDRQASASAASEARHGTLVSLLERELVAQRSQTDRVLSLIDGRDSRSSGRWDRAVGIVGSILATLATAATAYWLGSSGAESHTPTPAPEPVTQE